MSVRGGTYYDNGETQKMTRSTYVLLFAACICMFAGVIFAHEDTANGGTLRGRITDTTAAQAPIEGVEVKIIRQNGGKEYTATTDANGDYKRSGLLAGRYLINIYKRGYGERLGKPVTIVNGGDHFVPHRMHKNDDTVTQRWIKGLLQHVLERMGERYNLEAPVVELLCQSVLEALNVVLEQTNREVSEFARTGKEGSIGLLAGLVSHPDCKAAFTKYLTEAQLQDYMDFIKTLRQRDQQAVSRQITAWLDQQLSLTADQRKNVEQLILDTTENESFPVAIRLLEEIDSQGTVNLVRYKLKIALDGILSHAQSKVWQGVVNTKGTRNNNSVVPPVSESQLWQLVEAKLIAHTELLGTLDENALRRLTVATKGVVQQYLETPDKTSDIINHPLYQQAIKDVLSKDAFIQYKEIQAERESFYQQALRDLAVASMDTQLILDDAQRQLLETTAAELTVDPLTPDASLDMFYQLLQRIDGERFSPWQQELMTFMRAGIEFELRNRMWK